MFKNLHHKKNERAEKHNKENENPNRLLDVLDCVSIPLGNEFLSKIHFGNYLLFTETFNSIEILQDNPRFVSLTPLHLFCCFEHFV